MCFLLVYRCNALVFISNNFRQSWAGTPFDWSFVDLNTALYHITTNFMYFFKNPIHINIEKQICRY